MGLADIVRNGVAIAHKVTKDLQATVTIHAWTDADDTDKPTYAGGKDYAAIVEHKTKTFRRPDGEEIVANHRLTFLEQPKKNGADNRREPIDPRDKIVLPDGTTGKIVEIVGFVDAESSTGGSYFGVVWMQ